MNTWNNFFKVKEKVPKNDAWVGVGKMKTKFFFVVFSNDCSILELMFCTQNFKKLLNETLFCYDCRALALKLSEHLKKKKNCPTKLG